MESIIKINGLDISQWLLSDGYDVERMDLVDGGSGRTMSGKEHKDVIARIDKISLRFIPLTDKDMQTLLRKIEADTELNVQYISPAYGPCTGVFHVGSRKGGFHFRRNEDGFWTGLSLELIEADPAAHKNLKVRYV